MRQKGRIRSWNDERGFGFIEPNDRGKDVFLHISALSNRHRRPAVGQVVTYAISFDAQGRPRASRATLPGDRLSQPGAARGKPGALIATSLFLGLVAYSVFAARLPALILWVYVAVSLITYLVYAFDKTAAKDGAWRIREATLHWLSLAGGWPGALIAQQTLRHKSRKRSFRSVFWMTVFVNVGIFAWILTPTGSGVFQSWIGGVMQRTGFEQRAAMEWAEPRGR